MVDLPGRVPGSVQAFGIYVCIIQWCLVGSRLVGSGLRVPIALVPGTAGTRLLGL